MKTFNLHQLALILTTTALLLNPSVHGLTPVGDKPIQPYSTNKGAITSYSFIAKF